MSGNVKFNPNLEQLVLRSSDTLDACEKVADAVGDEARKIATWGDGSIGKGIKVHRVAEKGRVFYRVSAMDFKSHWFEFGTVHMKARPFLSRGAERAGLKIEARRGGK